jgi:hypothetical protein
MDVETTIKKPYVDRGLAYSLILFGVLALIVAGLAVLAAMFGRKSLTIEPSSQQIDFQKRPLIDIDLVYTWVDTTDAKWRAQKDFYAKVPTHKNDDAGDSDAARFPLLQTRDCNEIELYWSMLSVATYAPWVRRVYIVTQRPQRPFWLQYRNSNDNSSAVIPFGIDAMANWRGLEIAIVHHDRILDPNNLPVFNSVAIESGLHRCPHLAEHFLYFNDDTYIGAPLYPSALFDSKCKPYLRALSRVSRFVTSLLDKKARFCWAQVKDLGLVEGPLSHQGVAISKSILRAASNRFASEWQSTACSRFRRPLADIPPIGVSMMFAYTRGQVYVQPPSGDLFRMRCAPIFENITMCALALKQMIPVNSVIAPHLFCINPQAMWPKIDDAFKHSVLPHLAAFYNNALIAANASNVPNATDNASFESAAIDTQNIVLYATCLQDAVFNAHELLCGPAKTIQIVLGYEAVVDHEQKKCAMTLYREECICSFYRRRTKDVCVCKSLPISSFDTVVYSTKDAFNRLADCKNISIVQAPTARTVINAEIVGKILFDIGGSNFPGLNWLVSLAKFNY